MANQIDLKNAFSFKQTKVDLTIDGLTDVQANCIFNKQLDQSITVRKFTVKNNSFSRKLLSRLKFE